ncbi:MAG: hypothetical protein HS117_14445 [Verrucomicrobiaceae bacterium]|nr:hypothetical protein [Verrucomicrobiaceae bacterium]
MSSFRLRPRFSHTLDLAMEEVRERIVRQAHGDGDRCEVKCFPGYLTLRIPDADQHYWSPQLNLSLESDADGKTRVEGTYGPNTNVWSTYLYAYLLVGTLGLFSGIFGACQWCIGDSAWGLWIFAAMVALAGGLYVLAQFGQKLAAQQTFLIHRVYEDAVGHAVSVS